MLVLLIYLRQNYFCDCVHWYIDNHTTLGYLFILSTNVFVGITNTYTLPQQDHISVHHALLLPF